MHSFKQRRLDGRHLKGHTGKVAYFSIESAFARIREMFLEQGKYLHAYDCRYCTAVHITSQSPRYGCKRRRRNPHAFVLWHGRVCCSFCGLHAESNERIDDHIKWMIRAATCLLPLSEFQSAFCVETARRDRETFVDWRQAPMLESLIKRVRIAIGSGES